MAQAQHASGEGADLLDAVVEHLPITVGTIALDGEILYATKSVEELLGLDLDEVVGSNILDHLHPDDHERLANALLVSAESPTPVMGPNRARYRTRGGDWGVLEGWTFRATHDPDIAGFVLTVQDVTLAAGLEAVQTGLVLGTPTEDLLAELASTMRGLPVSAEAFFASESGPVTPSTLPGALQGLDSGPTPWEALFRAGSPLAVERDAMPERVRLRAQEAGLVTMWAEPVELPRVGGIVSTLVLWRYWPGEPTPNQRRFLDQATGLAALAFERDHYDAELRHAATHDSLTGVPNRAYVIERLDAGVGAHSALLYLDLDGFKGVNDTFGHVRGDEVLRQAVERMGGVLRSGDLLARLGGDEFVVLLEDLEACSVAESLAERLVHAISAPYPVPGMDDAHLSVSIGIAWCEEGTSSAGSLVDVADRAMYEAKRLGGERLVVAASL